MEDILAITTSEPDLQMAAYVDDTKIGFPASIKKKKRKKVMKEIVENLELAGQKLGHGKKKDGYLSQEPQIWLSKPPFKIQRRREFNYLGFGVHEDSANAVRPDHVY